MSGWHYLYEMVPKLIIAIPGKDHWRFAEQQVFEPGGVGLAWQVQEVPVIV